MNFTDYKNLPDEIRNSLEIEITDISGKTVARFNEFEKNWFMGKDLLAGEYFLKPVLSSYDYKNYDIVFSYNGQKLDRLKIEKGRQKLISVTASAKGLKTYSFNGRPSYEASYVGNLKTPLELKLKLTRKDLYGKNNAKSTEITYTYGKKPPKAALQSGIYIIEEISSSDPRYHIPDKKVEMDIGGTDTVDFSIVRDRADIIGFIEEKV